MHVHPQGHQNKCDVGVCAGFERVCEDVDRGLTLTRHQMLTRLDEHVKVDTIIALADCPRTIQKLQVYCPGLLKFESDLCDGQDKLVTIWEEISQVHRRRLLKSIKEKTNEK